MGTVQIRIFHNPKATAGHSDNCCDNPTQIQRQTVAPVTFLLNIVWKIYFDLEGHIATIFPNLKCHVSLNLRSPTYLGFNIRIFSPPKSRTNHRFSFS